MAACKKILKEYTQAIKELPPNIVIRPQELNLFEWHFVLKGPENTPFEGGFYHGKLEFPEDFPAKMPVFRMITPNGRFRCHWAICIDPPASSKSCEWPITTLMLSVLNFMQEQAHHYGSVNTPDEYKRQMAKKSLLFNLEDKKFCEIFPDIANEIRDKLGYELPLEDDSAHSDEEGNWKELNANSNTPSEAQRSKNLRVRFQVPEKECGENTRFDAAWISEEEEVGEDFGNDADSVSQREGYGVVSIGAPYSEEGRQSRIRRFADSYANNTTLDLNRQQMLRILWFMMLISLVIKLCIEITEDFGSLFT